MRGPGAAVQPGGPAHYATPKSLHQTQAAKTVLKFQISVSSPPVMEEGLGADAFL